VKGTPTPDALDRLRRGGSLDGRTLLPAKVHLESRGETAWVRVTLHEGKKNQIVRMMDLIGHPVRRLRRLSVGPVQLGALPAGKWRYLDPEEVRGLRVAVGLESLRDGAERPPEGPRRARTHGPRPRRPAGRRRGFAEPGGERRLRAHRKLS